MAPDAGRWWSLTRRRRRVVTVTTVGSGLVASIIVAAATGWANWLGVLGLGCFAAGVGYMVTTIGAPMVGDRPEWKDPLLGMDRRTRRRALRCVRRRDLVGAPTGVDLEQFAFYWGRRQTKSLRLAPLLVLVVLFNGLTEAALWYRISCLALLLAAAAAFVYGVRDMRLCRRFLLQFPFGEDPGSGLDAQQPGTARGAR